MTRESTFLRYSADLPVEQFLGALRERPVRAVVLVRKALGYGPLYYPFRIDDDLLDLLLRSPPGAPISSALGLHEHQARFDFLPRPPPVLRGGGGADPRVLVDRLRGPVGVVGLEAYTEECLYPIIEPSAPQVADTEILDIHVRLTTESPLGAPALKVSFPPGFPNVDVLVSVSEATGFTRPVGAVWAGVLTVDRSGEVSPTSVTFRLRAHGPGPYAIAVAFHSGKAVLGEARIEIPAKGQDPVFEAGVSAAPIPVRPEAQSAERLQIIPTAIGHEALMWRAGSNDAEHASWSGLQPFFLDQCSQAIEQAGDLDALRSGVGTDLWVQAPAAVRAWLASGANKEVPLIIESEDPLLPFEAMVLNDAAGTPLLGADRPVLRWILREPTPAQRNIEVRAAACLRPVYDGAMALQDAADEEQDLLPRLPIHEVVRTRQDLDALNRKGGVSLVHFAGHAEGGLVSGLKFGGGELVRMTAFYRTKLFERPPFLFINGCQAALTATGNLAAFANIPKTLIVAHAPGVIASVIRVKSAAAREAARLFYEALAADPNVGRAIRAVRRRAETTPTGAHAGTFLSYLAYAPEDLTLTLHKA